jgi:hypothetical protein
MQLHHVAAAAAALIKCAFASHLVDEYAASCQGYAATRINETSRGLEAELHLIGKGCDVYSPDIPALRLTVEHQSGMLISPRIVRSYNFWLIGAP